MDGDYILRREDKALSKLLLRRVYWKSKGKERVKKNLVQTNPIKMMMMTTTMNKDKHQRRIHKLLFYNHK